MTGVIHLPAANDAWITRRRGLYLAALESLREQVEDRDVFNLLNAFGLICDYLGQFVPDGTVCDPYTWTRNGEGAPSPSIDGELLNPAYHEAMPHADLVFMFAADLRSDWLDRLAQACGHEDRTWFLTIPLGSAQGVPITC